MGEDFSRVLIMVDGDFPSLVAAVNAKEGMVALGAKSGEAVLWPAVGAEDASRLEACLRISERVGLGLVERRSWSEGPSHGVWSSPSRLLLDACTDAANLGRSEVVWPAHFVAKGGAAGAERGVNLELATRAADRALLVSRLMALDAGVHGVPSLRVEMPFVDLNDREVADLAVDLGVSRAMVECCWWWSEAGPEGEVLRERWAAALKAAGFATGAESGFGPGSGTGNLVR